MVNTKEYLFIESYNLELENILRSSSLDGGIGRNPSLPQKTKRRITTNIKSIKSEVPENQTARNSDNQGIKETVTEYNQTSKAVNREKPSWAVDHEGGVGWGPGADSVGGADLKGNWDSEVVVDYGSCHSGRNSQSHTRVCWKVETSRLAALFLLWPFPHRQPLSAARRVALLGEYLRSHPLTN